MPCSERHTGEYLGTGSPRRATQAECEIAARDYMDQDLGTVGTELMVEALDIASGSPVPERCIIEARGSHLLDGTVHDLGVKSPPIVQ